MANPKKVIVVGSTRRPKLAAVEEALGILAPQFSGLEMPEVLGMEVASGVRHTPLSRDETMAGARNRAEALLRMAREKGEPWEFCIGLEGGIEIVSERAIRWVFLENWAYVCDRNGRGAFGRSGAIALPEVVARQVVDEGVELSEAIDSYAGESGVRDAQGAWGVLTRNLITRQDSFRIALVSAFAALLT